MQAQAGANRGDCSAALDWAEWVLWLGYRLQCPACLPPGSFPDPFVRGGIETRNIIFYHSSPGHFLQSFRVAIPLHSDLGSSAINLAEVIRREFD